MSEKTPMFPKPNQVKKNPIAVRIFKDGREACNLNCKEGRDIYGARIKEMWIRQDKRCCLEGFIEGCPGRLALSDAVYEHELGRGFGSSHRDDRIYLDGKWQNGAAHFICNSKKGSQRINYNKNTNFLDLLDVP